MSSILSKVETLEDSTIDKLYYEQLRAKEKIKLEEELDCSITQIRSRIEGYITEMERGDEFRVVTGTGILGNVKENMKKLPFIAVSYRPKFLLKPKTDVIGAVESMDDYLTKRAVDKYEITIPVPLRILEEMNIANKLKEKVSWMATKTTYKISDDMFIISSMSDNDFMMQAYFSPENRKNGIRTLTDIAKKFEEHFKPS